MAEPCIHCGQFFCAVTCLKRLGDKRLDDQQREIFRLRAELAADKEEIRRLEAVEKAARVFQAANADYLAALSVSIRRGLPTDLNAGPLVDEQSNAVRALFAALDAHRRKP